MKEIWIERDCSKIRPHQNNIIAYSNTGKIKRQNGEITAASLRQLIDHKLLYRILAEKFLPKTPEDIKFNRCLVDHITHDPKDMCVNDVRNIRWCNNKENSNFSECKENMRKNHADISGENNPMFGRKRSDISEETRKKLSDASKKRKGWHHSEETKEKIRKARLRNKLL